MVYELSMTPHNPKVASNNKKMVMEFGQNDRFAITELGVKP